MDPNTGSASFIVLNTAAGTTNPTITVTDSALGLSKTSTYNYVTSAANNVAFTGQATQTVKAGQNATYTVQLQDVANNALKVAGQTVDFYFASNGTGATINNYTGWKSTNAYTAVTNASGQATVTLAVPSTASVGQMFSLYAKISGQATPVNVTGTVSNVASYGSAVGLGTNVAAQYGSVTGFSWPTSAISAGSDVATGVYAYATNAIGQAANTFGTNSTAADQLKVTLSNTNVLSFTGANAGLSDVVIYSGQALPTIVGNTAGTATVTIQNLSNPDMPTLTENVTVAASAP